VREALQTHLAGGASLISSTTSSPARRSTSTEAQIGLDIRFGDPDDDGRAVEAIAEGFAELGCTLGGEGGAPIVSGGS
jgi:hypothetical protein